MAPVVGRVSVDFPAWEADQLFALAGDIESYPEFIPWCRRARILDRGDVLVVDNHFGAGPADLAFRSTARLMPPGGPEPGQIEILSTDGPFRRFRLMWRFEQRPAGGCRVTAEYEVAFRSFLLQSLARMAVHEVERRITARFRDRAAQIYGV